MLIQSNVFPVTGNQNMLKKIITAKNSKKNDSLLGETNLLYEWMTFMLCRKLCYKRMNNKNEIFNIRENKLNTKVEWVDVDNS